MFRSFKSKLPLEEQEGSPKWMEDSGAPSSEPGVVGTEGVM